MAVLKQVGTLSCDSDMLKEMAVIRPSSKSAVETDSGPSSGGGAGLTADSLLCISKRALRVFSSSGNIASHVMKRDPYDGWVNGELCLPVQFPLHHNGQ